MAVPRIPVPQLADGTDGELITWSATGAPTTVAVGTSGHVLTSNGVGAAPTFQANAGASSGIAGSVQFSGGSGTFSSDATNFFWDDTANQFQLTGGTSYGIQIAGQNGGVNVVPTSAITGGLIAFRASADATGSVSSTLANTSVASATAHAFFSASTSTGGGD